MRGAAAHTPRSSHSRSRRQRRADTIQWLNGGFAQDCPGYPDRVVLLDSTPVQCGRSGKTARRSELAVACAHHYSPSPSR